MTAVLMAFSVSDAMLLRRADRENYSKSVGRVDNQMSSNS